MGSQITGGGEFESPLFLHGVETDSQNVEFIRPVISRTWIAFRRACSLKVDARIAVCVPHAQAVFAFDKDRNTLPNQPKVRLTVDINFFQARDAPNPA